MACTDATNTEQHSDEFMSYPSSKIYSNSGYNKSNRYIRRKMNRNADVKRVFQSMPSAETASLYKLRLYMYYAVPKMEKLFLFFTRSNIRNMRFRRKMLSDKNLAIACRELADPPEQRTLVVFGDLNISNKGGVIKKNKPGPVMRLQRKLREFCDVMVVNEYLTSKIHHDCKNPARMENQKVKRRYRRDRKLHTEGVHKVFHCLKRKNGCGASVNRDVNGSKNILAVGLFQLLNGVDSRPERLQRPDHFNKKDAEGDQDVKGRTT